MVYISFIYHRKNDIVQSNPHRQNSAFFKMAQDNRTHQAISAYFIGPKAENLDLFQENIKTILDELRDARLKYFPEDGVCTLSFLERNPRQAEY